MPKIYPFLSLNSPVKRDDDNLWKRNLLNFIIRIPFHKLPARQEKKNSGETNCGTHWHRIKIV